MINIDSLRRDINLLFIENEIEYRLTINEQRFLK